MALWFICAYWCVFIGVSSPAHSAQAQYRWAAAPVNQWRPRWEETEVSGEKQSSGVTLQTEKESVGAESGEESWRPELYEWTATGTPYTPSTQRLLELPLHHSGTVRE